MFFLFEKFEKFTIIERRRRVKFCMIHYPYWLLPSDLNHQLFPKYYRGRRLTGFHLPGVPLHRALPCAVMYSAFSRIISCPQYFRFTSLKASPFRPLVSFSHFLIPIVPVVPFVPVPQSYPRHCSSVNLKLTPTFELVVR